MDEMKFTCTDPDCYQWQGKHTFMLDNRHVCMYSMCQVSMVGDRYAIAYGSFLDAEFDDDLHDIASFFDYDKQWLADKPDLLAECAFEYFIDDFYENVTQGPIPTYKTAADACQKLDVWMGECHMDMWLKD